MRKGKLVKEGNLNKGGLFRERWLTGEEESMEKRLGKALIEKGGGHKKLLKRSTKFMNNYDKLNSCEFFFVSYLLVPLCFFKDKDISSLLFNGCVLFLPKVKIKKKTNKVKFKQTCHHNHSHHSFTSNLHKKISNTSKYNWLRKYK